MCEHVEAQTAGALNPKHPAEVQSASRPCAASSPRISDLGVEGKPRIVRQFVNDVCIRYGIPKETASVDYDPGGARCLGPGLRA